MLSNGIDDRTVQELLGHNDVNNTQFIQVIGQHFTETNNPLNTIELSDHD